MTEEKDFDGARTVVRTVVPGPTRSHCSGEMCYVVINDTGRRCLRGEEVPGGATVKMHCGFVIQAKDTNDPIPRHGYLYVRREQDERHVRAY